MAKSYEQYTSEIQALVRQLEKARQKKAMVNDSNFFAGSQGQYGAMSQIDREITQLTNQIMSVSAERKRTFPNSTGNSSGNTIGTTTEKGSNSSFSPTGNSSYLPNNSRPTLNSILGIGTQPGGASNPSGDMNPLRPGSAGPGGSVYTGDSDSVLSYDDAREGAKAILDRFGGLGSLTGIVTQFILDKKGEGKDYTPEDIMSYIRNSDAYKKRFAGNEARAKANLPTLSEVEYLQLEDNYRSAMQQYLPKGFYDTPEDFVKFMANNISAEELGTRAKTAYVLSQKANKNARKALKDFYGVGDKEIAAYFLDPKKATPLLTERANAAIVGGEALRANLQVNKTYAETLAQEGYTESARGAFTEAAETMGTTRLLGSTSGTRVTTENLADAALQRNVKATRKVEGLRSQQRARFGGSSAGTNILGTDLPGNF